MKRSILIAGLLGLFLVVPFAGTAQADSGDFLDKVAGILKRFVDAGKMEASDARTLYNAVRDKVEALEERIEAIKDKLGDWKDDCECPAKDDDEDDLDEAKEAFKDAMRKANLRRRIRARLAKVAERLKKFCDDDDDSADKAEKKWRVAARKCYRLLDDTTKARLENYAKQLKQAVANGRITRLEAVRMWIAALKKACAAQRA